MPEYLEDADGDGYADLVFDFKTQKVGFAEGDTEATLTGNDIHGVSFYGTDSVNIITHPNK